MIKAGAIGYLLKDTEKSVLEKALREIVQNEPIKKLHTECF